MMKTISRQRLGVGVGAGLTAQPGARGQAQAYDDSVGCGCLVFKNHRESPELFHANLIGSILNPSVQNRD